MKRIEFRSGLRLMKDNLKIKINVQMPYFPTEDENKLKMAVKNIFPDIVLEKDEINNFYIGSGKSLSTFIDLLKRQRIRDTARTMLLKGSKANKTYFKLNKQAAVVSKINFIGIHEPQVLGEISVYIESDNILKLIEDLTVTIYEDDMISKTQENNKENE
jgi:predicted RNA binding protein with dsRBD fold (UPF0201 family)